MCAVHVSFPYLASHGATNCHGGELKLGGWHGVGTSIDDDGRGASFNKGGVGTRAGGISGAKCRDVVLRSAAENSRELAAPVLGFSLLLLGETGTGTTPATNGGEPLGKLVVLVVVLVVFLVVLVVFLVVLLVVLVGLVIILAVGKVGLGLLDDAERRPRPVVSSGVMAATYGSNPGVKSSSFAKGSAAYLMKHSLFFLIVAGLCGILFSLPTEIQGLSVDGVGGKLWDDVERMP